MFNIIIFLSLLSFYLLTFLFTTNIYEWLCIHPVKFVQSFFIAPTNNFLCDATYKFLWGDTYNMPYLAGVPTYIYLITKMDSLLTK